MLLTVALRLVRLQVRLQLESLAALGDVTDKIALQTLKKVTVSGEGWKMLAYVNVEVGVEVTDLCTDLLTSSVVRPLKRTP